MVKYDLEAMARRATNRRRRIVILRRIETTTAQAKELASFYLQSIALLEKRTAKLIALYAREVARALQHDAVSDLGNEMDEISIALNRLVIELTPELRQWALRKEEWHRGKWKRAVLDAVSVDLGTLLGPEDVRETIEAFLVRNTSLIRDVNEEARGRIADSIFRGFQRRSPATEIAKEIREATAMARKRSIRIAGHQIVSLASELDEERIRQAGIEKFKYRHSGKKHPREEHKARDGKIYYLNSGKEVGGPDQIEPGDEPGVPPFCGCTRQAVLDL